MPEGDELYENDKCKVCNSMTEMRIVNSNDIVMSSEEGNWKNNDEYEISLG